MSDTPVVREFIFTKLIRKYNKALFIIRNYGFRAFLRKVAQKIMRKDVYDYWIETHEMDIYSVEKLSYDPLISVVVPVYNVEEYLEECINSIIQQTYAALDIILVDDGSTDRSGVICESFKGKDHRIRVYHKENEGADSARKFGIIHAAGEYVAYVDGDDWVEKDMFECLLEPVHRYGVDVSICGIKENYLEMERERKPYLEEGLYSSEKFDINFKQSIFYEGLSFRSKVTTSLNDKIYKKSILEKYQMRPVITTPIGDDTFVTIPAVIEAKSIFVLQRCLYHYRIRNNSLKHILPQFNVEDVIASGYLTWVETMQMANDECDCEIGIQNYLIYVLAMKAPDFFDRVLNQPLALYGGIPTGKKIVLYGAGQTGIIMMNYLRERKDYDVIAWVDRDFDKLNVGYPLQSPKILPSLDFDYILVTIMRKDAYESAKSDYVKLGIDAEKIRWIDTSILERGAFFIHQIVDKGESYEGRH